MRKQRTDGNIPWNCGSCIPLLIIIMYVALWGVAAVGDDAGAVLAFPLIIIFGLFYLWLPSKLWKDRWYLEVDETGITYKIFFITRYYAWENVKEVSTEKSPEFSGKYDDWLVIRTEGDTARFFLHNFDMYTKRQTVKFTDTVIQLWTDARE